ncbi:tumor protein p63-regulated gene 1 protein [Electrophorus electricus]|uniref:HSac2 domain-containing protein n=1 Tax=Electrophorus electricus TaxID=8005 RepID=A0A4W4EGV6_ELEEL|nr:tumor protein p63-regulated gene 1 protein [Electrophorus electricus]
MTDADEASFRAVQLEQDSVESPAPGAGAGRPRSGGADTPGNEDAGTSDRSAHVQSDPLARGGKRSSAVEQFKLRRFFVLRLGTLDHAIEDIKSLVDPKEDGAVQSVWLMAEIDHWNNEKERLVFITEKSLLLCKYDFIMLNCEQIQRIPLNLVDRIAYGAFTFPPHSLLTRDGEGVRIFWDRLREPSFMSRWNPFALDYPYTTLTYHPVYNANDRLARMCEIHSFREQLAMVAQKVHAENPVPGKANGVLVLNQPLVIEAYVGVMSVIGNQNKLGYCLARGNIGF